MAKAWQPLLAEEKQKEYFVQLMQRVEQARETEVIFPPESEVFNALKLTAPEHVKVVILGQDPYHGPGQAHGLSFSVPEGVKLPPSLRNILKAIIQDYPEAQAPTQGDLTAWAQQGVLLLNTVLTVAQGQAHSHANWGWETFTDTVIERLANEYDNIVFMLWGAHAQKKAALIPDDKHCILKAPHPSPLSAHRGFFEAHHFVQANQYLMAHGRTPIQWAPGISVD
ncbi:MAG TPA: uracil-DNA glycosylase [Idiomarina sp.]|jgi:uracil-DNA glycosylase|nr:MULTISPECIES: uracil-DNA glycosylase [Idiomarina]KXS36444.1 MAG: uracil-DNA glycosylase [Idiomarina sp. T82-3]HAE89437.1 uracil-DNA glycosylase [Idiomarina sp.]|tara:strand:+ start:3098 stop:3772 length:675 start_codon:yes stop_codon:yes gene_type:complete